MSMMSSVQHRSRVPLHGGIPSKPDRKMFSLIPYAERSFYVLLEVVVGWSEWRRTSGCVHPGIAARPTAALL